MKLRTEEECRNDKRFVVCKDKEEARSAYNAGLLWVLRGEECVVNWAWLPQSQFIRLMAYYERWPANDFAVLVEEEDDSL